MTTMIPQCLRCRYYVESGTCDAYPSQIPEKVLFNEVKCAKRKETHE